MTNFRYISAAAALFLLASCGKGPVSFDIVSFSGKTALQEGATDSISISITVEYPEMSDSRGQKIAEAITGTLFGNSYLTMEPASAMEAWADSLTAEYRDSNLGTVRQLQEDGYEGPFMGMTWAFDKSGKVTGSFGGIIGYNTVSYSYTGGAHGGITEINLNFEESTGKLLEQEDIFAEGFENPVGELLLRHLNDGRDEESRISLLVDGIEPNGNFSIGPDGVTFTYNQYEIAAYVFGVIDILVPAKEIRPYIRPGLSLYD